MKVHFWTLHETSELLKWDPDVAPGNYLDGRGHSFFEPYARLRIRSSRVEPTIGAAMPRDTEIVVVSLEELRGWKSQPLIRTNLRLAAAVLRCPRLVVVRNDLPLSVPSPPHTSLEVMPSMRSVVDSARQVVVPPFPQRGLRPRDPARGDRIEVMALKAMSRNVPEWVEDPRFVRELRNSGVTLRIDTESDPAAWPDFHAVDLALCVRRHHPEIDENAGYERKPPTKLINAWSAGVVPIAAREVSYVELARESRDTIFVDSADQVLRAIRTLQSDPVLAEQLRIEGNMRSKEFTVEAVVGHWERMFAQVRRRSRITVLSQITRTSPELAQAALRYLLRYRRRPSRGAHAARHEA